MKHFLTLPFLLLVACADGSPTNSSCPPTSSPTYASFGQTFFTNYCTGCHSANASNRHGAPGDQNYDTEADIRRHANDIDIEAAKGPGATNTSMPDLSGPVKHAPTDDERAQLGQMLACMKSQ